MDYRLSVKTAPTAEPVTLDEAKAHLRVDQTTEDDLIQSLLLAARERAEAHCSRAFISTVFTMTMDAFPPVVYLPRPMVSAVSAIRYLDDAGDQQTLSSALYRAELATLEARITPAYGEDWPTTYPVIGAVEVDFTAGYGTSGESVPAPIKHAIKLLVGTFYEHREAVVAGVAVSQVPLSVEWLLGPYRVWA